MNEHAVLILAVLGAVTGVFSTAINILLLIHQRRERRRREWRPTAKDVASSIKNREVYEERW